MKAITEEGEQVILQCVDCERWFPEGEIMVVSARHTKGSYAMCTECLREDARSEREE
jgi:hypothetical protein